MEKTIRKTNKEIRELILKALKQRNMSIHEISATMSLHWTSVKHHLTWLKGSDLVAEVYSHPRLKVFSLKSSLQASKEGIRQESYDQIIHE